MFDLGWQEFLLIAVLAVIVVGPKDLPRVVRQVSQWVRKARSMAREFQSSLEEVAREAELDDVRREVQSISKDGVGKAIEKQFDPDGSIRADIDAARKSANTDEIESELKELDGAARSTDLSTPGPAKAETAAIETPAIETPAIETPAIETAEQFAAKSAAGNAKPATVSESAAAAPEKPRAAASGES